MATGKLPRTLPYKKASTPPLQGKAVRQRSGGSLRKQLIQLFFVFLERIFLF
jgi:hypothetical protein